MAKLRGPALSALAAGTLGDSVVFSSWKGRPYAKKHTIPTNPKSTLQVSKRSMLRFLSMNHSTLSAADMATWDDLAAESNISSYNAFVAYNLDRWEEFLLPTKFYPASEANAAGQFVSLSATAGVRSITIETIRPSGNFGWGMVLHRSQTPAFTKTQANAVFVHFYSSTMDTLQNWNDGPLNPGTYYYRISSFSTSGRKTPDPTFITSATIT
jgi:hypothetical protein